MRGIVVVAEHSTRANHFERRFVLLHEPHLPARSLGAQQYAVVYEKRILHVARGVVGRNIERLKIIVIGLHLGTVVNYIAVAHKVIGKTLSYLIERVYRADRANGLIYG